MTLAELERKINKMDETQKQIIIRQNQIEEVLNELNKNVLGIHTELSEYRYDQTEGSGKRLSVISTISNSSIGVAMTCFLISFIARGGTL